MHDFCLKKLYANFSLPKRLDALLGLHGRDSRNNSLHRRTDSSHFRCSRDQRILHVRTARNCTRSRNLTANKKSSAPHSTPPVNQSQPEFTSSVGQTRSCSGRSSSGRSADVGSARSAMGCERDGNRQETSTWQRALRLQHAPLASLEDLFLLLAIRRRFGQRHFDRVAAEQNVAVQFVHGLDGVVTFFEMNESVILYLLDALDRSVGLKRLLQLLFRYFLRQIAHVEHFHLLHVICTKKFTFRPTSTYSYFYFWFGKKTSARWHWTYLGHDILVGLLLRVGPVDDDVAAEDFDAASAKPALGQRCRFVRIVLQEAEAAILTPVIRRAVDYHFGQASCVGRVEMRNFN